MSFMVTGNLLGTRNVSCLYFTYRVNFVLCAKYENWSIKKRDSNGQKAEKCVINSSGVN